MSHTLPTKGQSLLDPQTHWRILHNHEGRYSIHPAARDLPAGWEPVGTPDTREACLSEIARLWTDMRPEALKMALQTEGAV